MQTIEISKELLSFIEKSPSMFHSVSTIASYLDEEGFMYVPEDTDWNLEKGKNYYTVRNHSSIIAFKIGKELSDYHFQICSSHSDSPTFKERCRKLL